MKWLIFSSILTESACSNVGIPIPKTNSDSGLSEMCVPQNNMNTMDLVGDGQDQNCDGVDGVGDPCIYIFVFLPTFEQAEILRCCGQVEVVQYFSVLIILMSSF